MDEISIHPDAVLEALLAKGPRSNKAATLKALHEICTRQYGQQSGALRDFSLSAIGRLCEAQGLFKGRVLYNAASADYVSLITAWASYSGPVSVKPPKPPKVPASHEYLLRIEDPAIRQLMQAAISERDSLRAQVNLLKSHAQVVIDKRPLGATLPMGEGAMPVLLPKAQLTDSEREALERAISPDRLDRLGCKIGPRGEVLDKQGRILFDLGFVDAIRKILGDR
jgi:hypothetical protein